MKNMITFILFTAMLCCSITSCDNNKSADTPKVIETTAFYSSTDEAEFQTYFRPNGDYVGDPMPFYDPVAKDFKVLYLHDTDHNGWPCYHPIWGVSTTDAANYTLMGEIIPCGAPDAIDAAIGTGSTIYNEADKLYYTYYTGVPAQGIGALMMATSPDFKNWTKSTTFYLRASDYGYRDGDFRDPFVYKGDDGMFHMLVSARKAENNDGVIAEFTSPDLKTWNSAGIFMNMKRGSFYECVDLFKMGDWWYMVYSEQWGRRRVQYFKGRTLDELKATTNDIDNVIWPDDHEGALDADGFYAGKTASDGTNRYLWGWNPRHADKNNATNAGWAGSLVAHKLIQLADGTLVARPVDAIDAKYTDKLTPKVVQQIGNVTASNNRYKLTEASAVLFSRLNAHNKISFTVTADSKDTRFGCSFVRATDADKYYSLVVNPEFDGSKRKLNFEVEGKKGTGFQAGLDSYFFNTPANNVYRFSIYSDNSVAVVYINDTLAYTVRLYDMQHNCWSINSYNGTVTISDLEIYKY